MTNDTVKMSQALTSYKCPVEGCDYETGQVEAIVAAPLLSLHANSHAPVHVSSSNSRPPPVDRPKITSNCEKADWLIFKAKWKSFKSAANITGEKKVHQLIGCLDHDLATLLYNENGAPEKLDELNLLDLIESVAVKPENIWVTRTKLHAMSQDSGEPVTSYAARLKGQARLCEFKKSITCEGEGCTKVTEVDFTDTIIMGELVRGLADVEVKKAVLGEVEQKTELDGLIKLIQAKEYAKSSTAVDSPSVSAMKQSTKLCPNCNTEHIRGSNWRKHCPANGKKCNDCRKTGHFAICCKSSKVEKAKPSKSKDKTPKKIATVSSE